MAVCVEHRLANRPRGSGPMEPAAASAIIARCLNLKPLAVTYLPEAISRRLV
jgi:hypothetical protein